MHGISSKAPHGIDFKMNSVFNHKAPGHTQKMYERIKSIKQGENLQKAYERLVEEGKEDFAKENFPKKLYAAAPKFPIEVTRAEIRPFLKENKSKHFLSGWNILY